MSARRTGWALCVLALAAPFGLACSAGRSGADREDGGHVTFADSGGRDVGAVPVDDSGPSLDSGAVGGLEADANDPAYASECLDGRDQNLSDGVDCADPSCAAAPSCCIGVASASCCTIAGPSATYDFACTTPPCDDMTDFTTFGDVGPVRTSDNAYAPESDRGTDGGGILAMPLDPRAARITITAALAAPATTTETDAVGVGLVSGTPSAHLVPVAAVVVSAARHEVLLLLGESIAAAAPVVDDQMHTYVLSIAPDGSVTATSDGIHLAASVALPSTSLRAAFFGRATNPGSGTTPARIGSLAISSTGCDQPTALTRMGALAIVDHTGSALLDTITHTDVATDGTTTVLSFAAHAMAGGTGIFVGVREADGSYHVRTPPSGTQPIATAAGDDLESPALVASAGRWTLFATRVHAGTRSLVTATSTGSDPLTLGALSDISVPELSGSVSAPAPFPNDPTRLVVRHQLGGGEVGPTTTTPELVLLSLGAGATAAPMDGLCGADADCPTGVRSENHLYASRVGVVAFDADDVDEPAIVFYDHVYRLYYAGRLGSRWSIGMLVSADLGYWRPANGGAAVLGPTGRSIDAVSVQSPSPILEDGVLSLYYLGSDGDTHTFAVARGNAIRM